MYSIQRVKKLLEDFPDVLSSIGFMASKPRNGVQHHLLTNPGPPVFAKHWRLDPEKLDARIFRHGDNRNYPTFTSPWSSPHHMVKKKNVHDNTVADALSCPSSTSYAPVFAVPVLHAVSLNLSAPGFDFSSLHALQSACPSVQSMISNPSLSVVCIPFLQSSILCDVSSGSPRPLVPTALCQQLFLALHGLSHPGTQASQRLLSSKFVWPGIDKDVGLWTRSCIRCQHSKIQSHMKSSIPRTPVPDRNFSTCIWIWWGFCPPARGLVTS